MRTYADAWYDSGAWSFIGVVVGSAVALIGIVVGARYTARAADPGRSLLYSMTTIAPLLRDQHLEHTRLAVSLDGTALIDPQVVILRLVLRGRRDITSADFEDNPLVLDIGVPILDLLAIACEPRDSPPLTAEVEGNTLRLAPALIHRDEIVTVSVLIDGGRPCLAAPVATLANVRLRALDIHANPRREPAALARAAIAALVVAIAITTTALTAAAAGSLIAVVAGSGAAAVAMVMVEAVAQRMARRASHPR